MACMMFLNEKSMINTIAAIINEATSTTIAELCNSGQVGQDTLWTSSSYDSLK
jgi:hypothetical protein